MKKLLGLMAALIVSTSAVFAGGYKGDFQLLFGAGFDSLNATQKYGNYETKINLGTGLFTMNLETWHVFGSNDVFKFGFMAAVDEGLGGTTSGKMIYPTSTSEIDAENRGFAFRTGLFIAPAFSFFIGDVVRFNVAPGLSILFADMGSIVSTYNSRTYTSFFGNSAVGAGIELQAKFCPNAKVSPVIGYRFTANFADSYKIIDMFNNSTTTTTADCIILTNTIQVGITWNW